MEINVLNLKHYPSGFLGSALVSQTHLKKVDEKNATLLTDLYKTVKTESQQYYTASIDVDIAYKNLMNRQIDDFVTKENILKISKHVFGTKILSHWLNVNHQNDEFSFLHMNFLDDVLNYVFFDKEKKVSNIFSWSNILFSKKQSNKVKELSETQKIITEDDKYKNISIDDFLLLWLSKENGFEDLVICLAIMFGSRVSS